MHEIYDLARTSPDLAQQDSIFNLATSPDFAPTSPGRSAELDDFAPSGTPLRRRGSVGRGRAAGEGARARSPRVHPSMHVAGTHPRGLRAAWCSCGAPVLQGVDEDLAAAIVKADPAPLSATGEAMARMNGRNTYDLRKDGGVFQLMRRNSLTIISRPPGSKIWCGMIDVLAEHRCGSGPLPGLPSVHPAPTPDTLGGSRACPF